MSSKRFKKLKEKMSKQSSETIENILPLIKKNCTTKFDESVDLSFQINNKQKKMADLNAHDVDEAAKIIAGSAKSMGIEVVE